MRINDLFRRVLLALCCLAAAPAWAQFRVIGYLPSWTGEVSAVPFGKLTHVNYAFLIPNANGSVQAIENPAKLQSLVAAAHANNVKVLISVGGWLNGDPSAFVAIGSSAGTTTTFTNNLLAFVSQYNLDGVDIDWEHPDASTAGSYAALMQQLATALHGRGQLLSTAVAGGTWAGPGIQASVYGNLDFMNIMAYDDTPPNHSTYALAKQSLDYWQGRGLPKSKTVLGVPFYGQPSGETYAALLARGADPNADLFQNVGYNGIPTIKSKTNLAFDQGSGLMIWQLAGDAAGANSLLTAISQVVLARTAPTPPPASGVATLYRDCNYGGTATSLPAGDYTLSQLQAKGMLDNDLSSLQVNAGYQLVLYENDNFTGASLTLTANAGCLVSNPRGAGNWNDQASSLRVQAAPASFSQQLEAEAATNNSGMTVEACSEGGQNMGYISAGNFLVWNNITIPTTGSYLLEYRVASGASGGTISADLNAGSVQLGSTSIPGTGGWQSWKTVSKTVSLNAGTYNFGIYAQTGGFNLNWVRLSKATTGRENQVLAAASAHGDGQLSLYPNPVRDQLQLATAPALAGSAYRVVNAVGQTVRAGTLGSTLNVAALPAGLYLLVVKTPDAQTLSRRFVKE